MMFSDETRFLHSVMKINAQAGNVTVAGLLFLLYLCMI